MESIEEYQMIDTQKYRIRLVRTHMDYITTEINFFNGLKTQTKPIFAIENSIKQFFLLPDKRIPCFC